MPAEKTLGLVPQDDRPVSLAQPVALLEEAGYRVLSPPLALLGHRDRPGDPERLAAWIEEHGGRARGWVVSLDMLVHGGLVASRTPREPSRVLRQRLAVLERLRRLAPGAPIFAFQAIRRKATSVAGSEDLAAWEDTHRGLRRPPPRRIGHVLNLAALREVAAAYLDSLVLLQEDTTTDGPQHREHARLVRAAVRLGVSDRVILTAGTDEAAQLLLVRLANRLAGRRPRVRVRYSSAEGAERVALYEDRALASSVAGQIRASGAVPAGDGEADLELFVWCPDRPCRDLWLGGVPDDVVDAAAVDAFVADLQDTVAAGKAVALADVAYANGADPTFMALVSGLVLLRSLRGYAGWNTASNAIGSALAQGLLPEAAPRALCLRLIEDWGYQAVVRAELRAWQASALAADEWNLPPAARLRVEDELDRRLAAWAERFLRPHFGEDAVLVKPSLPWSRLFELGLAPAVVEPARRVPVAEDVDVLVCGGGAAGWVAAVAAARHGARTLLLEAGGSLGGAAIQNLVLPLMTFHAAPDRPVVRGIPQETIERVVALGGSPGHLPDPLGCAATITPVDPEVLRLAIMETLVGSGARLALHTAAVDVLAEGARVVGVLTESKSGRAAIRARVVIDATGDADLAARAGAGFVFGRATDGLAQPMTLMFRMAGVDGAAVRRHIRAHPDDFVLSEAARAGLEDLPILGVAGFFSLVRAAQEAGELGRFRDRVLYFELPRPGEVMVNMTRIQGRSGARADGLTEASLEGLRQVHEVVRFLRTRVPGFAAAGLVEVARGVGVRETRHLEGDYTLTAQDVLAGREFEDGVARGAFPIDIHAPSGTGVALQAMAPGTSYAIPYRCMLPRGLEGLLVAGRAISATHEAAASARLSPTCMALGEAAGTAAALAVRDGVSPRQVDPARLRRLLQAAGALV